MVRLNHLNEHTKILELRFRFFLSTTSLKCVCALECNATHFLQFLLFSNILILYRVKFLGWDKYN